VGLALAFGRHRQLLAPARHLPFLDAGKLERVIDGQSLMLPDSNIKPAFSTFPMNMVIPPRDEVALVGDRSFSTINTSSRLPAGESSFQCTGFGISAEAMFCSC
jgi:hypothetical protein